MELARAPRLRRPHPRRRLRVQAHAPRAWCSAAADCRGRDGEHGADRARAEAGARIAELGVDHRPRRPAAPPAPARASCCGHSASCAPLRAELRSTTATPPRPPCRAPARPRAVAVVPGRRAPPRARRPAGRPRRGRVAAERRPRARCRAAAGRARRVADQPLLRRRRRSMGTSWAAFLSGAFEPGRRVAIDKPPIDLWLQVASTRLLGFGRVAAAAARGAGRRSRSSRRSCGCCAGCSAGAAALAGGLALAVLPVRGDRRAQRHDGRGHGRAGDRGRRARRARGGSGGGGRSSAAGVLLGLAFEVKLAEALRAGAPRSRLWLLAGPRGAGASARPGSSAAPPSWPPRWRGSWPSAGAAAPAAVGPGRLERLAVARRAVYNGVGAAAARATRSRGRRRRGGAASQRPRRGARRRALARRAREHRPPSRGARRRPARCGCSPRGAPGTLDRHRGDGRARRARRRARARRPRRLDRIGRGGLVALALWLIAGLALASVMPACARATWPASIRRRGLPRRGRRAGRARTRRAPPGAVALARRPRRARWRPGRAVRRRHPGRRAHRRDAAGPGGGPLGYLRARDAGTGDELAVSAPAKVGPLIARDGRPVLILSDGQGRARHAARSSPRRRAGGPLRAPRRRLHARRSGNARTGCLPVVRWARAHGVDVSRAAGQPHAGALYALIRPAARRQRAEELPRPPRRRERSGRRVGPRAAGPAVRDAVEAHVLDSRRRRRMAPGDLGHAGAGVAEPPARGSRRSAAIAPATARRSRA